MNITDALASVLQGIRAGDTNEFRLTAARAFLNLRAGADAGWNTKPTHTPIGTAREATRQARAMLSADQDALDNAKATATLAKADYDEASKRAAVARGVLNAALVNAGRPTDPDGIAAVDALLRILTAESAAADQAELLVRDAYIERDVERGRLTDEVDARVRNVVRQIDKERLLVGEQTEDRMDAWVTALRHTDPRELQHSPYFLRLCQYQTVLVAASGTDETEQAIHPLPPAEFRAFLAKCETMMINPGDLSGDDVVAGLDQLHSGEKRLLNGIGAGDRAQRTIASLGGVLRFDPTAYPLGQRVVRDATTIVTMGVTKDEMAEMLALGANSIMRTEIALAPDTETLDNDVRNVPYMSMISRCGLNPVLWLQECKVPTSGVEKRILGYWNDNGRKALREADLRTIFLMPFMRDAIMTPTTPLMNARPMAPLRVMDADGMEEEVEAEDPPLGG